MNHIRRIAAHEVYGNDYGTLFDDEVAWPSGRRGWHLRLRVGDGTPGVVIVPRYGDKIGLVHTFRYAINSYQWGFPRGYGQNPDPLLTARSELHEEMGLSGQFAMLGWFTPDSGIQEMRVAVVLADVEGLNGDIHDTDEVTDVAWMTPEDLKTRLGKVGWDDGMTMAALALLDAL